MFFIMVFCCACCASVQNAYKFMKYFVKTIKKCGLLLEKKLIRLKNVLKLRKINHLQFLRTFGVKSESECRCLM